MIYGLIGVGALLAAESGRHESYLDTLASAALATLLFWLLHSYAGLLGRRLAGATRPAGVALPRAMLADWGVVRGAAIPLVALLLAWAAGAAQGTAVTIALWCTIAGVVAFEALAARRTGGGRALLVDLPVGVAMGLAILALRALLH